MPDTPVDGDQERHRVAVAVAAAEADPRRPVVRHVHRLTRALREEIALDRGQRAAGEGAEVELRVAGEDRTAVVERRRTDEAGAGDGGAVVDRRAIPAQQTSLPRR